MGASQNEGCFLEDPYIIRTRVYWGLHCDLRVLGNYHIYIYIHI